MVSGVYFCVFCAPGGLAPPNDSPKLLLCMLADLSADGSALAPDISAKNGTLTPIRNAAPLGPPPPIPRKKKQKKNHDKSQGKGTASD